MACLLGLFRPKERIRLDNERSNGGQLRRFPVDKTAVSISTEKNTVQYEFREYFKCWRFQKVDNREHIPH